MTRDRDWSDIFDIWYTFWCVLDYLNHFASCLKSIYYSFFIKYQIILRWIVISSFKSLKKTWNHQLNKQAQNQVLSNTSKPPTKPVKNTKAKNEKLPNASNSQPATKIKKPNNLYVKLQSLWVVHSNTWTELVGSPSQRISFFSLLMMFMAMRTLRAS